jgi:uncharacterized protein
MTYTIKDLREKGLIIFEAKMGSHAYGTNIPTSDVDLRGVWIQPLEDVLKYGYKDQVADKANDIVFYELKRFLELVKKNNPNILELLNAPEDCIIHKDPIYDMILKQSNHFITKKCKWTFAGYAIEQIRKARGYNKKMNWEEAEMTRRGVIDFCYILQEGGSIQIQEFLDKINAHQNVYLTHRNFALAKVDHAHDVYAMYEMKSNEPSGIVSDTRKANDVQILSIPKGRMVYAYLTFNKDAYSTHCKRYKEYQTWLKERNEDRFKMNKDHGKNYDSKNMMHTFRLLKMALEIAESGCIHVRRSDEERKKLLKIRHGEYEYDDLIEEAEAMIDQLDDAFDRSVLPEKIEDEIISDLELQIRKLRYGI